MIYFMLERSENVKKCRMRIVPTILSRRAIKVYLHSLDNLRPFNFSDPLLDFSAMAGPDTVILWKTMSYKIELDIKDDKEVERNLCLPGLRFAVINIIVRVEEIWSVNEQHIVVTVKEIRGGEDEDLDWKVTIEALNGHMNHGRFESTSCERDVLKKGSRDTSKRLLFRLLGQQDIEVRLKFEVIPKVDDPVPRLFAIC